MPTMNLHDNVAHPVFTIDEAQSEDSYHNFLVKLTETRGYKYYLRISPTALAIWQPESGLPFLEIARQIADKINILHGTAGEFTDNYIVSEQYAKEDEGVTHRDNGLLFLLGLINVLLQSNTREFDLHFA